MKQLMIAAGGKIRSLMPRVFCALAMILLAVGPSARAAKTNTAYFAGGCFWCTEEIFQQSPGVSTVVSGFMNGAETIRVSFDPTTTSYEKLLGLFWRAHDPTDAGGQGPDRGAKYRSAIFVVDEEQRAVAEKSRKQQTASGAYPRPIATTIERAGRFVVADEHHQNFCRKNPNNPYIQQWLVPKLKKLGLKQP